MLVTMPPDRGGGGRGGLPGLLAYLAKFPKSAGATTKRVGPFSAQFASGFDRLDP